MLRANGVSALVSLVISGAFAALVLTITDLGDAVDRTARSRDVLVAADQLKTLALDVETGERGFVITGKPEFLQPWYRARARFPAQAAEFQRMAFAGDPGQGARARVITQTAESYIRDYSAPTVEAARRDLGPARTAAVTEEGKRQMDALRARFAGFVAVERGLLGERQARAATDARRAITAAAIGIGGSMALILASGGYLTRAVVRPLRRAAVMAGRVADGDLSARMPETGPAEIGNLERSLNRMAGSLEASREEIRRVAEEQAALRRVATLVARGAPACDVFGAVAAEVGGILGAACTAVSRHEADGGTTVVGSWCALGRTGLAEPVGSHWPLDPRNAAGQVLRTGRPTRAVSPADPEGAASSRRERMVSVASPVNLDGRLWGVVVASAPADDPPPAGAEDRMGAFTELIATAIANAESRRELAASRARVVAAADETRRRIERDLHDGTQQRLIALGLALRAAEAGLPPDADGLRDQLSQAACGLADVVAELQELSRGLHPAILSQGGLGPALRALSRRSAVPVDLNISVRTRLPEHAEVASYYVVSEALTNIAKHARASVARVDVDMTSDGARVRLSIRDDGVGGAEPGRGSGLIGLRDRVEAIGGGIEIASPPGAGTSLLVSIPTALPSARLRR